MQEEIKAWLGKAEQDIAVAKYDLKGDFLEDACFHVQQAIEKALKALYIKKFHKLLKVHDLHLLGKKVEASEEILDVCKELTTFYIAARYPGSYTKFEKEKVLSAIEKAEKVLKWVKEKI